MNSIFKPVSLLVSIFMLIAVSGPCAWGGLIQTASLLESNEIRHTRNHISKILKLPQFRAKLLQLGITPTEARALIDSLTDTEVRSIADQIDNLPAGGNGWLLSGGTWGIVGIAIVVTFVILLISDLLGYTDFFNIR